MDAVVLVIHLMLALALIAVVLLQQSEGGGLGIGGGSGGGMGGFATARGTANLLTRLTAILAFGFLVTSISLALLAKEQVSDRPASILDLADEDEMQVPVPADDVDQQETPITDEDAEDENTPTVPSVPISE